MLYGPDSTCVGRPLAEIGLCEVSVIYKYTHTCRTCICVFIDLRFCVFVCLCCLSIYVFTYFSRKHYEGFFRAELLVNLRRVACTESPTWRYQHGDTRAELLAQSSLHRVTSMEILAQSHQHGDASMEILAQSHQHSCAEPSAKSQAHRAKCSERSAKS